MYVYTQDGNLINLSVIRCISVVENYPDVGMFVVAADDICLYSCSSEDEGKQIIDCIAKAIKADTKVYYGRFRA
jgi:hypothetical protein